MLQRGRGSPKEMFFQNQFPYMEVRRPFILGVQSQQWKATISHWFMTLRWSICELLSNFFSIFSGNGFEIFFCAGYSVLTCFNRPFLKRRTYRNPIRRGSKVQWESHHHGLGGSKVPQGVLVRKTGYIKLSHIVD